MDAVEELTQLVIGARGSGTDWITVQVLRKSRYSVMIRTDVGSLLGYASGSDLAAVCKEAGERYLAGKGQTVEEYREAGVL